jgi:superfamily II DNA/RNA helicase
MELTTTEPETVSQQLTKAADLAKELFGYEEVYDWQLDSCRAILEQHDCILSAPTGGGKTLTFILPLLARWTPGSKVEQDVSPPIVLIVSPLVELMLEQVCCYVMYLITTGLYNLLGCKI